MHGRMFKGSRGEEEKKMRKKRGSEKKKKKKKKRRLDLSWVGPAFKILPSIKSSGLYLLRILTKE